MKSYFAWVLFGVISITLLVFMTTMPPLNYGGDIAEYYGITETLLIDQKLHLTPTTIDILSKTLQPAYFIDPGYYIEGVDGNRYPVHFIFYSLLAFPIRLVLKLFSMPEVNSLRLTNLAILTGAMWYLMHTVVKPTHHRIALLLLVYLSPILWFISWPGPDLYYVALLLVAIFLFFRKHYIAAILLTSLASWHSQPLLITVFGMLAYYLYQEIHLEKEHDHFTLNITVEGVLIPTGIALLSLTPYVYNYLLFQSFTPWTILQDGWTQINGFGLHNAGIQKLFEQLFDLNVGLFWYAPLIFILGIYQGIKERKKHKGALFLLLLFYPLTALFYQTNPAWHYGTAGYGPTRHILFLLPLLLYFSYLFLSKTKHRALWLLLLVFSQLPLLMLQNFAFPNILATLQHSPYATFVLNRAPGLYNPTPEIFVDRTTQTDEKLPRSAVYTDGGECKKAYVLLTDANLLTETCGYIPEKYTEKLENPYRRKTNYERTVVTTEATFWPDPGSCAPDFLPIPELPFVCMRNIIEAVRETHVADVTRLENLGGLPGVWKLKAGEPVKLTIPPGYFIDHTSLEGIYVNY